MKENINSKNITTGILYSISYDSIGICPLCKHAIKPQIIHHAVHLNNSNETFFSILNLCNACYNSFVTEYQIHMQPSGQYRSQLLYCE